MTDEQGRASEKKERVKPIDVENVEFEFVRKVEKKNRLDGQYSTILSEQCTLQKTLCQSQGCQVHRLRYYE